jgi:hypothetical protein
MPIRSPSPSFFRRLLGLLLLFATAGCAAFPARNSLPAGVTVEKRIDVTPASPVAWHPDGSRVALVRDGLCLWTPASGETKSLAPIQPAALAWSPDGERLAAVLPAGADTRLLLFAADGQQLREAMIRGRVPRLAWTAGNELLFIAATQKTYKFGGNFILNLYHWPIAGEPAAEPLFETTVMPRTIQQWGEAMPETAIFSLAPLGDFILFGRLRDPPAFSPYLEIALYHLETGMTRPVAKVPLGGGFPIFTADGEAVLFNENGSIQALDPWTQTDVPALDVPRHPAVSAAGRYLLIDDVLQRDGERIAEFPAATEGWFAPAGNRLLLRHGNQLILLAGLSEPAAEPLDTAARERLLLLRKWRASGLISQAEFLQQKQRNPSR